MACGCRSLLHSTKCEWSHFGLYIWILVILTSSTARAFNDTTIIYKDFQKDSNQEHSTNTDGNMSFQSADNDLHLATSFLWKSASDSISTLLPATSQAQYSWKSASDSISTLLPATSQAQYSVSPSVLDNLSSVGDFIFNVSGVSPSETVKVTDSVSHERSERYDTYTPTAVTTVSKIWLDPSMRHGSVFVNISTFGTSSLSVTIDAIMNTGGPSSASALGNTSADSVYILSDTETALGTTVSQQSFSAIHPHETYNSTGERTVSSMDVSLEPGFVNNFESNTVLSAMSQLFSDFANLSSGDNSYNIRNISVSFVPLNSMAPSLWNETIPESILPERPHDAEITASLHQSEHIVGSTVILHATSSSATGIYFQPQPVDTKDWAVPVTVCLSVVLLIAVLVLVVTCCRQKTGHSLGHYRDGEGGTSDDTEQKQQQTETTTVMSTPEIHTVHSQNKPRADRTGHVGQRAPAKARKISAKSRPAPGIPVGRNAFEMDRLSRGATENVYAQQNSQSKPKEHHRRNEEMLYDHPTSIHGSPHSRRGFSESIQKSPKSGNQLGAHKDDTTSTLNKTLQPELKTSKISDRMSQHELKAKTRNMLGNECYTSATDNADSRFSYTFTPQNQQDLHETAQHGYSSSNDGDVSDKHTSDHCLDSWNDRRYTKGDHGMAGVSVSGDKKKLNGTDADSLDHFHPNIRALSPGRDVNRPGLYKCVSFDESRGRMTDDMSTVGSKDKSPTRKISTISESAMTFLTVPREGFTAMTSAYETVYDLSEVGHPHGSSQFFIGPCSDQINSVAFSKHLESNTRRRSIDNIEENTDKLSHHSETNTKMQKPTTSQVSERGQVKPRDDYIFPIVKKAQQILEVRRNKKLASSNSSDRSVSVATDPLRRNQKPGTNDTKNRETEMTENEAFPLQVTSVQTVSSTSPLRQISHSSKIPTIILTEEEGELRANGERQNSSPNHEEAKPTRVRRLARANNPFLIEVDSLSLSEKVRRSSAPSMIRHPTPSVGIRTGMIRSASNDQLSRPNGSHFDSYPRRPWSSEFFDLVINSAGYTKDERFKKMIDDRYDALFGNKYPYSEVISSSDGQNFHQDLSPRLWKLLTSAGHTSLPRDGLRDSGYSHQEAGDPEIMLKLNPPSNSTESEQLPLFDSQSGRLNLEGRRITKYPEIQPEIPKSYEIYEDRGAEYTRNKNVTHTTAENETVKARLVYIRESQSPRPNLASGTDGMDNGFDIQSLTNWPGGADRDKENSRQIEVSPPFENINNKLSNTEIYWQSFEDDLEVERQTLANKPVSEEAFISENLNNLTDLAEPSSELQSQETANKIVGDRNKDKLRRQFTETADACSMEANVEDLAEKCVPDQTNRPFSEGNPTVDSQTSLSHEDQIQIIQKAFDDDFSLIAVNIGQQVQEMAPAIFGSQTVNDVLHNDDQDKQPIKQKGPQIPPRKTRRRAPKNPKQTRPPSPFLSTNRADSESTIFPNENASLETDTNTKTIADKKKNSIKDLFDSRSSMSDERYDRSDTNSIASTLSRSQQRSFSVGENTRKVMTRPQRAVSVETDQPSEHLTYYNKWSHFFNKMEPRFLSSANNTVLQHDNLQDVSHDSVSLTDPVLDVYFESTVSSPSLPAQKKEQNRLKALLLDDSDDSGAQISNV